VALAVLNTIEQDKLLTHIREIGGYLKEQLGVLKQRHRIIKEVRGLGLMVALELTKAKAAKFAVGECLKRGVIINRTHEVVLRLLPPFIIEKKHVDELASTLDGVFADWQNEEGDKNARN
jgi:acetylornithine aminotransferase/acetylornithine/N-succinyldiaminopimelate aminotransferase